jgi:hypothetical protein
MGDEGLNSRDSWIGASLFFHCDPTNEKEEIQGKLSKW